MERASKLEHVEGFRTWGDRAEPGWLGVVSAGCQGGREGPRECVVMGSGLRAQGEWEEAGQAEPESVAEFFKETSL